MAKIISRLCYRFKLRTISPLSIGGNYTELTDHDLIRYGNSDEIFITSSSISGCFFTKDKVFDNYFDINHYGNSRDNLDSEASCLFVSDGLFEEKCITSTRDGIRLGYEGEEYKQTLKGAKFSNEIIENNQDWSFYITITITEKNKDRDYDSVIKTIASRIENGIYRIGYKQNRGYGQQKVLQVYKQEFNKDNYIEYLSFDGYKMNREEFDYLVDEKIDDITLTMPVKAISPFCIKNYACIKHMPDYEQIRGHSLDNKELAAIPATSLNGAIRSTVTRIAASLNKQELLENENFDKYILDEIYLPGNFLIQTRNSIDRFSASTINGALYTESIFIPDENNEANIKIRFKHEDLELVALFYLALSDIDNGYTTIGGNEAIGRGFFTKIGDIEVSGKYSKEQIINKLKEVL